jgi:predicted enzyme related to lactoylglutathione lyase
VPAVAFQRVPEPKSGKARTHLDVEVEDFDEATVAIEALGGRWVEPGPRARWGPFTGRCMVDPEGNEFDIVRSASP